MPFQNTRKAAFYRWLSDGELVGSVAAFSGSTLPSGWLLCDGSAVSRETYAALFSVIGATYGAGDGSTTFNLPNLTDRFIQGNATAGTVKAAGLPNITGGLWNVGGKEATDNTEAFYTNSVTKTGFSKQNESMGSYYLHFDASRSNSIYGNSTTVQPPALTMKFAIYSGVVSKKLWLRTI